MFTAQFWKQAAERGVKTFAQTLAAVLTIDVLTSGNLLGPALATAAVAALLSVLTSLGSDLVGDPGPSLVPVEPAEDPVADEDLGEDGDYSAEGGLS